MVKKALLLGILLLAAFLRFHRLEVQSFWNDEGNSARLAERSLNLIIEGAAGDIHPPGYYLLLAAWRSAAGQSEFALRGLSAFAGVVLVALICRLGKRHFDEPAGLGAAFVAAAHPALIYYSQEARMYELAAALAAGCWLPAAGGRLLAVGGPSSVVSRSVSLAGLTALGLYTHYAFAFVVIALNLFAAIQLARNYTSTRNLQPLTRNLLLWLASQALALLLFLPWLPIALRQLTSWPAAGGALSPADSLLGASAWLAFGPTLDGRLAVPMLFGTGGALAVAVWACRAKTLPALVWLLTPTALTVGFGIYTPTFAKFLIVAAPALCLLVGAALAFVLTRRRRVLTLFLGVHLLACALALNALYFSPTYARADYRAIVRYLDSVARPRDAILLNAPNQWEVFTYYHTDTSNVFPVARSRPFDVPAQIAELESIAASHDRLFVVYWGEAQADPKRVIESWLNEHTFKAYDQWYGDVRLAAYAVPRAATQLQTRTDILLGDRIALAGYSLNRTTFAPGDILQLTLFWQAQAPIEARYKVFVHLVGGPAQPPVAQHDGEPGGGLVLTTLWQPGQTVADNHGVYLPLDLPPGDYTLAVGMYGVDDGRRLIHTDGDTVQLATITVGN